MERIIGLMGNSGVGKDEAADYLVTKKGFVKVSLADPMKRFCKEVLGFTDEQLWGPSEKRNEPDRRFRRPDGEHFLTPRYALQTLGTEWGRNCYQNMWVDYAIEIAQAVLKGGWYYTPRVGLFEYSGPCNGVVIPDCRFENEILAIRRAGGIIMKIVRPGCDGNVGILGHASELEQKTIPKDLIDVIIDNDSDTLADYHRRIECALAFLKRTRTFTWGDPV